MANFAKFKHYGVGHLLKHNNRAAGDGVTHANEDIDESRTENNYFLQRGTIEDVNRRLEEVFYMKRSDMVVLGEMVVTVPKNVKEKGEEEEEKFFNAVFDFYRQDLGKENIINAVVHKDETTPHIHIDFVPVVKGEDDLDVKFTKRGREAVEKWKEEHPFQDFERLCCYEKITRKYLQEMHGRLSDFVEDRLGYQAEITNGATLAGNQTVKEMKAIRDEAKALEIGEDIKRLIDLGKQHGISPHERGIRPLMEQIADLKNQIEVFKKIIIENGYTFKKDELAMMKAKKYTPAESAYLNFFEGSLVDADIEKNAVIVVELYDQIQRPSPQQKLIDTDDDLYRQAKLVQGSNVKVMWRNSRASDRQYLFIKTDNEKQTMDNLLLMEQKLREVDLEGRKVYMDKMETDSYDLAQKIFEKHHVTAQYYINTEIIEREMNKGKEVEKNM